MGSKRHRAHHLYHEWHDTYTYGYNGKNEAIARREIIDLIQQHLTIEEPHNRFCFKEIKDVMIANWTDSNFRPDKAKHVFEKIETYLIQVVKYPWKKEFHSIRVSLFPMLSMKFAVTIILDKR